MNCARWDLCGGHRVTGFPTAILGRYLPLAYSSSRPELTLGLCSKMRSKPDIHLAEKLLI